MTTNPNDEFTAKFNQILNEEIEINWIDFFDNPKSELGNIASTRLAISGLWNCQIKTIDILKNDVNNETIESAIVEYIKQLDNQIIPITTNDNEDLKTKTSLISDTLESLGEKNIRQYVETIIKINSDDSEIKDSIDNLVEWTTSVRSEVVEDLWGIVQDCREGRDITSYAVRVIDQIEKRYQRLVMGSLLLTQIY